MYDKCTLLLLLKHDVTSLSVIELISTSSLLFHSRPVWLKGSRSLQNFAPNTFYFSGAVCTLATSLRLRTQIGLKLNTD